MKFSTAITAALLAASAAAAPLPAATADGLVRRGLIDIGSHDSTQPKNTSGHPWSLGTAIKSALGIGRREAEAAPGVWSDIGHAISAGFDAVKREAAPQTSNMVEQVEAEIESELKSHLGLGRREAEAAPGVWSDIGHAISAGFDAVKREAAPQTSNVDQQLWDEIKSEIESHFVKRAPQTSNVDQQLWEEIESELKSHFEKRAPQTSNMDEQIWAEIKSEFKSHFE